MKPSSWWVRFNFFLAVTVCSGIFFHARLVSFSPTIIVMPPSGSSYSSCEEYADVPIKKKTKDSAEISSNMNNNTSSLRTLTTSSSGSTLTTATTATTPEEKDRLRRLMYSDLSPLPPEVEKKRPPMITAYQNATVVEQASWYQPPPLTKKHCRDPLCEQTTWQKNQKMCRDTCCARSIAVSIDHEKYHLVTTVSGLDLADLVIHSHGQPDFLEWGESSFHPDFLPCLQPGTIFYAGHEGPGVTRFFEEVRPNITVPYLLITGESDGREPMKPGREALQNDKLLLKWYGINADYEKGANHEKFQMMPLGLGKYIPQQAELFRLQQARQFHNPFGGTAQQKWIKAPALHGPTVRDTTAVLFVKFGINPKSWRHRTPVFDSACGNRTTPALDNVSCNLNTSTLAETYHASSKYLFGLSPPGNGLDCYRTYELLLNGVIPIVEYHPEQEVLFANLPVLQVKSWNHTQAEWLDIMRTYVKSPEFQMTDFDIGWERLYLHYWRRKVLQDTNRLQEIVEDDKGQQYYQKWVYTRRTPLWMKKHF